MMSRLFGKFLRNISGNTAIIFALGSVPLCLAIGAGVDYSRAIQVKAVYQSAADTAALAAVSKTKLSKADIEKLVEDYLKANGALEGADSSYTVTYSDDEGKVSVRVEGQVATSLMTLAGIPTMGVSGYSEVLIGSSALEMVLVLDNTASMGREGRMDDLKDAANALVDEIFKNAGSRNDIRIGIVPFGQYVNVGLDKRNKLWLDVPADQSNAGTWTSMEPKPGVDTSTCPQETLYWNNDGVMTPYTVPNCGPDQMVEVTRSYDLKWNGCVGSRANPLDASIGTLTIRYPGLQNTWCPSPITDLTNDTGALKSEIAGMNPVGETYIPAGLLWGWNAIDPEEPFAFKNPASGAATRVILLMTDGENTLSSTYPWHDGANASAANDKTAELCANIKGDNIKVYTVAFKVNNAAALNLLKQCASDAGSAYDASDKTSLVNSFKDVARSVAAIHISK